ncbi:MAG: transketolase [Dehalococcoidia bacterium]|nr:transketolase [Dehalococcoidia bacterium]
MLSVDAVQRANSGHPGAPMGAAAMAHALWTRHLRHNPADPAWPDRDRFVLSAGHASMLLYSLLYLTGYGLTLDDLKQFRQLNSRTPGHPERGLTPGVETTTGPLGQGLGNAVGMAMAERWLGERYNRPGHAIIDHHTYVLASDGDMMEGVASEVASLAGRLGLGKLIVLYDDNGVTIDGPTEIAFSEDVAKRYEAYGWGTSRVTHGNDVEAVTAAIAAARADGERPSLILVRTHIGYGSPHKQDSSEAHGAALGPEEVALTKEALGWPAEPPFYVPEEALAFYRGALENGLAAQRTWEQRLAVYRTAFPTEGADLERALRGELPAGWDADLPVYEKSEGGLATRVASGQALNALAGRVPELVGGSADLAASTNTDLAGMGEFGIDTAGRNVRFGVREHGMAAIANGMAAHGGVRPYISTFLVFSDYMRPSVRLAALMELPVIYLYTHDSVGLGEDGPTHQPEAHLAALRAIPNLTVLRPADANETAEAWRIALGTRGPVALVLTRQALPTLDRATLGPASGVAMGGYVLSDDNAPEVILIATGSEVALALAAATLLRGEGRRVRVVNMASWELFQAQPREYRESVLTPGLRARVSVEAAVTFGWSRYTGDGGASIGVDRFGKSAPGADVMRDFGFTPEHVADVARGLLG